MTYYQLLLCCCTQNFYKQDFVPEPIFLSFLSFAIIQFTKGDKNTFSTHRTVFSSFASSRQFNRQNERSKLSRGSSSQVPLFSKWNVLNGRIIWFCSTFESKSIHTHVIISEKDSIYRRSLRPELDFIIKRKKKKRLSSRSSSIKESFAETHFKKSDLRCSALWLPRSRTTPAHESDVVNRQEISHLQKHSTFLWIVSQPPPSTQKKPPK